MGGGGIIYEKDEEQDSGNNTNYNRNKIYNVNSPKSKNQQRNKKLPTNTEEIQEEDEVWQSTGQLPLLMMGSQQSSQNNPNAKNEGIVKQKATASIPHNSNLGTNIIITNNTFNYKSHH